MRIGHSKFIAVYGEDGLQDGFYKPIPDEDGDFDCEYELTENQFICSFDDAIGAHGHIKELEADIALFRKAIEDAPHNTWCTRCSSFYWKPKALAEVR